MGKVYSHVFSYKNKETNLNKSRTKTKQSKVQNTHPVPHTHPHPNTHTQNHKTRCVTNMANERSPVSAMGPHVFHKMVCVPAATENNARMYQRLLYVLNVSGLSLISVAGRSMMWWLDNTGEYNWSFVSLLSSSEVKERETKLMKSQTYSTIYSLACMSKYL